MQLCPHSRDMQQLRGHKEASVLSMGVGYRDLWPSFVQVMVRERLWWMKKYI